MPDEVEIGPETVIELPGAVEARGNPGVKERLAAAWRRIRDFDPDRLDDAAEEAADRIITGAKDLGTEISHLPENWRRDIRMLKDPEERRALTKALIDEGHLTKERRQALQSILLWGGLATWIAVSLVIRVFFPPAIDGYQSAYGLFFYSLATSLFLPTPFEILLGNAVDQIGWFAAILIAAVGKTMGGLLVLVLGQRVSEGMNYFLDLSPKIRRGFDWLTEMARRYGYGALFVLFAIPFMSDTVPLVIFSVLGMERKRFLAVMFGAILVRSALFILLF